MNPVVLTQLRTDIEALRRRYPELTQDEELWSDTVEGETDVHEIIKRLIIERNEALAHQSAMESLSNDYAKKSDRWAMQAEYRKKMILLVMDAAKTSKITTAAGTVSILPGRVSLALADGFEAPQGYGRARFDPDKPAIKAALEAGETMPGASLVVGDRIVQVRT